MKNAISFIYPLILAGCVSSAPRTPPAGMEEFEDLSEVEIIGKRERDFKFAKENFGQEEQSVCIKKYKNKMNDPDSFVLVSNPTFDLFMSNAHYGHNNYYGPVLIVFRGATFTGTIRAKNAFGGVITKSLYCHYLIKDGELKFYKTGTEPHGSFLDRY